MIYDNICEGHFISRPNRFIANIEIDGVAQVCHVKNTGRCAELLVPGCRVWVQRARNTARRTAFDLITVDRGDMLVNIDSQAPNRLFAEWAEKNVPGLEEIKPEQTFGDSRFDFRIKAGGRDMFVEVKGVTLERDGRALFPDAPTERGIKHLNGLARAAGEGYGTVVFFIIQMKGPGTFGPNRDTHPAFGDALERAGKAGVKIMAYDCIVTPGSAVIDSPVDIRL